MAKLDLTSEQWCELVFEGRNKDYGAYYLCRAVFQTSDHRLLMPACLVMGASLALACNLIARMPGFEGALPVNSVTALIGAPVVASVLFRKRKNELNE